MILISFTTYDPYFIGDPPLVLPIFFNNKHTRHKLVGVRFVKNHMVIDFHKINN